MSESQKRARIELPPEAEPARDFIEALVDRHEKRIAELEAKVADLTQKLEKLTPRNSSLPPSSEHPHAKPKRKSPAGKKRKQGGQKGHTKHSRELIPTEDCAAVVECPVDACRQCGGELQAADAEPLRHQVWELPPIEPIVTEYQLHRGHCSRCAITTCGSLPEGVPTGQCGPRLAAFIGLLMGHYRQSKRRTATFLEDLLNIPCSAAWTVKIQKIVARALVIPYEQLRSELCKQPQLFVDESPTKQKHDKAWLWVAVASTFAVFGVFMTRKRESLKKLIGDYSGIILNCDRAKMYFDGKRLQWCWAHLKRDIQKLIDSNDNKVKRLGLDLMRQERLLFELWRRYKAEEIAWSTFQSNVRPIRKAFDGLLLRGQFSRNNRLIGFTAELYAHRDWLWTFTRIQGIEPTNNTAERALRPAVIYRKLSFGTQSENGSRYLERILTVSETCRLQSRSAYQYLIEAVQAEFQNQPPPSLVAPIQTAKIAA